MRLAVSVPTFNTPDELLHRALRGLYAQTLEDLAIVVVNDGGQPLRGLPRDQRLVVYELPANRGRYFADAVVTRALVARPDVFWSPHDADDWSEPERFEKLLPSAVDGAVLAPYWRHQHGQEPRVQQPRVAAIARPTGRFNHLGHWCAGAYTVQRLARAGWLDPGFRIGFDTLHTLMIALTGPVAVHAEPAWHWHRRANGSLTSDPRTRLGSIHRDQVRRQLKALYQTAWERRHARPGSVITQHVPRALADEVGEHAVSLAKELA